MNSHKCDNSGPLFMTNNSMGVTYEEVPGTRGTQFYKIVDNKYIKGRDGLRLIISEGEAQYDSTFGRRTCLVCWRLRRNKPS